MKGVDDWIYTGIITHGDGEKEWENLEWFVYTRCRIQWWGWERKGPLGRAKANFGYLHSTSSSRPTIRGYDLEGEPDHILCPVHFNGLHNPKWGLPRDPLGRGEGSGQGVYISRETNMGHDSLQTVWGKPRCPWGQAITIKSVDSRESCGDCFLRFLGPRQFPYWSQRAGWKMPFSWVWIRSWRWRISVLADETQLKQKFFSLLKRAEGVWFVFPEEFELEWEEPPTLDCFVQQDLK